MIITLRDQEGNSCQLSYNWPIYPNIKYRRVTAQSGDVLWGMTIFDGYPIAAYSQCLDVTFSHAKKEVKEKIKHFVSERK